MSTVINTTAFLKRDGQSQSRRMPGMLPPEKAPVDNRSVRDFLEYVYKISAEINYFNHETPGADTVEGTWQDILNYSYSSFGELFNRLEELKQQQALPAHFSLLFTFLELYKEPQRLMNNLTGRHLDFYYEEVLGLKRKAPVPDTAHVVFELKKNTEPVLLAAGTALSGGKDNLKKERIYKLSHDIVVNRARVDQLKSVFVNPANGNLIHMAAVANSADGLGAELDASNPKWKAFGHNKLTATEVGFCLASDVLLMQEGERKVSVELQLDGIAGSLKDELQPSGMLQVSLTGAKGWTVPATVTPRIDKTNDTTGSLLFELSLTPDDPAVVACDSALHGEGFLTGKPVMKVLINTDAAAGYAQFRDADLVSARINVEVKNMSGLTLENDFGVLNAKKPFFPFGTSPENGANFWVGSSEVFNKDLESLRLNIEWKNIPEKDLSDLYSQYTTAVTNQSFTVNATFSDAAGWNIVNEKHRLFGTDAQHKDEENFSIHMRMGKPGRFSGMIKPSLPEFLRQIKIVRSSGKTLMQEIGKKAAHVMTTKGQQYWSVWRWWEMDISNIKLPKVEVREAPNKSVNAIGRKEFLHLSLNQGFLFREYRELLPVQMLEVTQKTRETSKLIKEPFSPEIQRLTLDYEATTGNVSFRNDTLEDYQNTAIELYHAGVFGQMREHAYARSQTAFIPGTNVKLLPSYYNEGSFYIGLSGLNANDSLCLLFQVAEGSADPKLAKADLQWRVLCDNYWKDLSTTDFIFDTTNDFLTSGVVKLVIPREATTVNTIMPSGLIWLEVAVKKDADAVCSLLDVQANAAIAVFEDQGNDPEHLRQPLAAGTITKLQTLNGAIKSVSQPYASFGGRMQEDKNGFYTRVSERLRHKERAVTLWDYERLVLQHFPAVYKVKCINHASADSFTDAGHTLVVVIPDLTNQNAVNPFQPGVDKNTLDTIEQFLAAHTTAWATPQVVNPFYEPVKIRVSVKLRTGYEFNYYQAEIDKELKNFLSPWAGGSATEIQFGGKVTEAAIVQLVEKLPYVDYITGLQVFQSYDGGISFQLKKQYAEAISPAAILVSHTQHEIIQS